MNILEIKDLFSDGGTITIAVAAVMTLVQIAPVKINPWSWLAQVIGRAINKEVVEKVDQMEKEVKAVRADAAEEKAVNCRARILRFGDECLHGELHTKDHFDQTLRDIAAYERYCDDHPNFENNVTGLTSIRIKEIYHECLEKDKFLK